MMSDEFGKTARSLSRNPLGIIGLAFVLVYAVAGVVATSTVFTHEERIIFVWFLVIFPLIILGVFYRLVTLHHGKLYAPSDFREDSAFLRSLDTAIAQSPSVIALEQITHQIKQQIEGQPLYKYTKLSEAGKQLVLRLHQKKEVSLEEWNKSRRFSDAEVEDAVRSVVRYSWAERVDDQIRISAQGTGELDTFVDLAYGRLR